ncbi:MAG: phage/plasmid primase, P4 family [Chloroflexota bacterium]
MSSSSFNVPKNQKQSRAEVIALIRRTLSILAQPGQTVELRIPGLQGKRTDSGYFNDFDKLASAAVEYENRAEGIYITVNPVHSALLARSSNRVRDYAKQTTSDKDVRRRRWLFIDFDPVRPAGISSSDEESAVALDRAMACRERLAMHAIPALLANSGNGAHLLVPIDWPNDETSTGLIKAFLALLDAKFSDEQVKVDTGMVGASHLIKLYGTMARKGDCIPERPHRRSMIVDVPDSLEPVNAEVIEKLIVPSTASAQIAKQHEPENERGERLNDILDHSFIDEVKVRLDMVAYAEQYLGVQAVERGHEYRLPGNAGFLINPEKGVWYHHGGQAGGDALDLVGNCLFGSGWNKRDPEMFKQALREAANFAGIPIPKGQKPAQATQSNNAESSDTRSDPAAKLDLLDVAVAWHAKYGTDLAWDVDRSMWRRWVDTHWQLERTSETLDLQAAQMMREVGVSVHSGSRTDGMLKYARGLCKRKFPLGQPLVNFNNGTLDLATMQLRVHEPNDHLTRCLPHDYVSRADFPRLQQFLDRTIPDSIAQQAYMTHIGAALVGDLSLHKAVILFGPTRSGKTTLLKLAQTALGYKPGQFPTSTLFSSESRGANSRATWVDSNPNLVCLDEFPQDALGGEGEELFKSMTAHGGVSMWLKYQDERDENTWTPKLMFATNNRLRYRDQSGALTRRLLIIECPNSVPETKQDGDLLKKLAPELGAFAAACIHLALTAQKNRQYPESAQMSRLLTDIETHGDSIKLWLLENCVFEDGTFESTAALYANYRYWCDENGVNAAGRPKMRDVITTYRPNVEASRQRVNDSQTGEIKLVWGLIGVRLRTIADDFPEEDPELPDPVPPTNGSPQEGDSEATRSGDPVDSKKIFDNVEMDSVELNAVVEGFAPNDRITGSTPAAMAQKTDSSVGEQQPLLLNTEATHSEKPDVLRYFPDLMRPVSRKRST